MRRPAAAPDPLPGQAGNGPKSVHATASGWRPGRPPTRLPGGGLPDYRQMVRSLKIQAAQATALPFVITERTPGFRGAGDRRSADSVLHSVGFGHDGHARLLGGPATGRARHCAHRGGHGHGPLLPASSGCTGWRSTSGRRMWPSLRVVEKLGFRDEGYRPRFLHINGEWADHRTFAPDRRGSARRACSQVAEDPVGLTGNPVVTSRTHKSSHLPVASRHTAPNAGASTVLLIPF